MSLVRPRWRPNVLPGACAIAECEGELDTGEGLVLAAASVPWLSLAAGRQRLLLCGSHAMATAPVGGFLQRVEHVRANPPANAMTGDLMTFNDYQVEGSLFMLQRWGALLSDDKGLGKTAQFLMALPDEDDQGGKAPVILVCPSAVKGGWADEIETWRPDYSYQILKGRSSWLAPQPGIIHILNYEILPPRLRRCRCGHEEERHPLAPEDLWGTPKDHPAFSCVDCKACHKFRYRPTAPAEIKARLGILDGTILGGDEVQKVKGPGSEQTKRWREVASACSRAWGLSASPLMNTHNDLFEIYTSLGMADAAWGTRKQFQELFRECKGGGAPSGMAQVELKERRGWCELGRTSEEVGIELPEIRYTEQRVTLTSKDIAAVEELLADAIAIRRTWALVKAGELVDPREGPEANAAWESRHDIFRASTYVESDLIEALNAAIKLGPGSKIGPEMATMRKILATAKMAVVKAYIEECEEADEPCFVFSAHRAPAAVFGGRKGWGKVMGGMTPEAKDRAIRAFQRGELKGLAGTIRAVGVGLNLQTRCRLVGCVDWDWTPEMNDQCIKRVYRRGQKRMVVVTSFVANHPVDRHVARILQVKERLIKACAISGVKA